jgi:steroid 5-alpha reductase family enzyme
MFGPFALSDAAIRTGSVLMIVAAAVVLPVLWFVPAPYGRHARKGFGPSIDARWAWIVMESPSVWLFTWVFLSAPGRRTASAWLLAALFETHYVQRTLVFPTLMRNPGRKPLLVAALAFLFNVANASLNAAALSRLPPGGASGVVEPRSVLGVALFVLGFALNVRSDATLRGLRKPGGPRYSIPTGGGFRFVTSPNYLGEIVEWTGFSIAAGTLPSVAFAIFTVANLLPRARAHHAWYREQFTEYPSERRALIPGIF